MKKGSVQKRINCPECNLPCAFHRIEIHRQGNFCWGNDYKIKTEEDVALYKYWKYKKNNFLKSEVKFLLSPSELLSLLEDVGISIHQVGSGPRNYNLARHGDTGNYEVGNCRFIPKIDNILEKEYGLRYIVNGITYSNTREVSEKMKCGRTTVRRRCESPKFPNWKLITL